MGKGVDPLYGALVSILWLALIGSGLYWASVESDWGGAWGRAVDRATSLRSEAAVGRRLEEVERSELARFDRQLLAREIAPAGSAPVIVVVCLATFAILRGQALAGRRP